MKMRAGWLIFLSVAVGNAGKGQAIELLGDEFRVNTYTTGFQSAPSLSASADGTIVIVWESPHNPDVKGVFGQRPKPPT